MSQSTDELLSKLHPITGPIRTPPAEGWSPWSWWLLLPIVAIALLLLRRRPSPRHARDQIPLSRDPDQLARAVRSYLSEQFHLGASTQTPTELRGAVPEQWVTFLEELDQLRFVPASPALSAMSALLRRAEVLIQADSGNLAGPRSE